MCGNILKTEYLHVYEKPVNLCLYVLNLCKKML